MRKLISILLLAVSLSSCITTESGKKVGIPTKLGYSGFWCSNSVGSIVRGGFSDGTGANGSSFDFVITDKDAATVFSNALNTDKQVKIHYHKDKFLVSFCLDSDQYLVDKVEILEGK